MDNEIFDIFISYRRGGGFEAANLIYEKLSQEGYTISFDIDNLRSGPFDKNIFRRIEQCSDFLLVVDPHCFDKMLNPTEEEYWVRKELAYALKLKKNIIPIRFEGVEYPKKECLPKDVKQLPRQNDVYYVKRHVSNLIKDVKSFLWSQPRKSTDALHPYLKVDTNLRCKVFVDGRDKGIANEGELKMLSLRKGQYQLKFVSELNQEDVIMDNYLMPDEDRIYPVDLLSIQEERLKAERLRKEKAGEFCVEGVVFKMVYVEGGSFMMGATDGDQEAYPEEKPAHRVLLDDYYIGETVVTQKLWKAVMGENPSGFKGEDNPVECVSFEDVKVFIERLNKDEDVKKQITEGWEFDLPTEAQWEFAARGGNKRKGFKYSGSDNLDEVGWYDKNNNNKIHPVKSFGYNELGIYDMSGNVWEWCKDWYGEYSADPKNNPKGPRYGQFRVIRGGSWRSDAWYCRVSYRRGTTPKNSDINIGFRLVLVPKSTAER